MKIAIIGAGISGLSAAHALYQDHELVIYEAADYIGGHAHTVDISTPEGEIPVDTGFIVFNEDNYPGFTSLLTQSAVHSQPTKMSFGVSTATGTEYRGSNPSSLFAQRKNLRSRRHWRMLKDITRFNKQVARLVADEQPWSGADRLAVAPSHGQQSIADFVATGDYSQAFVEDFLLPFGSAIWSASPAQFGEFPIRSYARFMANHGLLGLNGRKQWRTITGGSREYVTRLSAPFHDRIRLSTPVLQVTDSLAGALVQTAAGAEIFDAVIMASHSDVSRKLLGDPTEAERETLEAINYTPNTATLHRDQSVMPNNRRAWAAWNYHVSADRPGANVTYWMNELQALPTRTEVFVTLNRSDQIDPAEVYGEWTYHHPEFDLRALNAQHRRAELQGSRRRWYAGAYWGYGFHEDGAQSGLTAAQALLAAHARPQMVLAA
ncbi:MAG: FAD-dependent oxidoreductase [Actinomycetia bacterium]|nr:FAD-dependent oxidoreductase [Actinomycetes bacterium]